MDSLSGLFAAHRLLFSIPLFFSFFLGSLSVIGLLDLEALDLDLDLGADTDVDVDVDVDADVGADVDADVEAGVDSDLDAEADAGGSGVLSLLGLGMIPFSLFLIVLCFSFGWLGLLLQSLWGATLGAWVGTGWGTTLLIAPVAFVGAVLVTAPLARLLHPLFKDYGRASDGREILGKKATLTSGSVSPTFGTATVRLDSGPPVDISVRTQEEDNDLGRGDPVLVFDYDPDKKIYFVAPLSEEEDMLTE